MDAYNIVQHFCSKSPFLEALNLFDIFGCHKIQLMTIYLTYRHWNAGLGPFFQFISLTFNVMDNNESSLRQPMILTFLLHKSATTYQICSNLVSNFKLNCPLSKILKMEKYLISSCSTAVFWDTLHNPCSILQRAVLGFMLVHSVQCYTWVPDAPKEEIESMVQCYQSLVLVQIPWTQPSLIHGLESGI